MSFPVGIFISLRSTPRRGIAGSSSFNLARKLHVVSHGGCTDLHAASRARGPRPSASSPAPLPCVIDGGHSDRCRGGARRGSDRTSLMSVMWGTLPVPDGDLYAFFGRTSIEIFLPLLIECLLEVTSEASGPGLLFARRFLITYLIVVIAQFRFYFIMFRPWKVVCF